MASCPPTIPFLRDLHAALPRHGMWQSPVVVGVSGGADSVALLLGLAALARDEPVVAGLIVAHAEHDLRVEAGDDRAFVAALAGRLGLRCESRQVPVRGEDGLHGEGIEARARRLRYRFLEDVALESGARHVAVAHTADDQAETILHRALRGTGVAGLAGMTAARELCAGVALVRPLLAIPRATVRGWLADAGETWCEDASNGDPRYARNFLRHEILQRCTMGPYPAAADALVRLGGQAARLAEALASAAEHLLEAHGRRAPDGGVAIEAAPLAGLDPHLVAEVFVALWRREGWPQRDMTARHYAALAGMVATAADGGRGNGSAADFPGPVRVAIAARRQLVFRAGHDVISTRR